VQSEPLDRIAEWSVGLEISGTAVRTADQARDIHIADSLAGAQLPVLRDARTIVDIGSGAGFPGLVLAVALPQARVTLVDSVRKKMESAAGLVRELALPNVDCVWSRAEQLAVAGSPHREAYDVVTARALAPLPVLLEYAAPLLRCGGSLVAWKGSPPTAELAAASAAGGQLGFAEGELIEVKPFAGSHSRHFYLAQKLVATADRFPRRPGVALRRPLA
jgi:16S rRNA (guanine527-N7)-methyltransferase